MKGRTFVYRRPRMGLGDRMLRGALFLYAGVVVAFGAGGVGTWLTQWVRF